ncbi:MAG TPA: type II toxin-antitoxin system HipA family toxin, partial [Acidimicrobiales bacterium]
MSVDALVVLMGDEVAGTLVRLADRRLRFDYDSAYRESPDATPLSLSMPTQIPTHRDGVVTPWLWGLLPDNDAVLSRWAREFQVSSADPFGLLATPIGEDCPGTVRFCRPDKVDAALARPGDVAWLTDDEVGQRLRDLRRDTTAWLGTGFTGQFSLAGAQAKTALLFEAGRWGVPSGGTPTSHILKPAIEGLDDHDLNEHLCLRAAALSGLAVASSRVMRFADQSAVVIERYDRYRRDGRLVRIHQEDLVQALAQHPSLKYQRDGGPGPEQIVRLFHLTMPPRSAAAATEAFVDGLAWNWIIAGTDAHAKNYSLLLQGRDVALAPFYDVASALPYAPDPLDLHLAMKLGGEYRLKAHRARSWMSTARELGLDPHQVCARVRELAERAPDAFHEAAAAPDVAGLGSDLPARLLDAV